MGLPKQQNLNYGGWSETKTYGGSSAPAFPFSKSSKAGLMITLPFLLPPLLILSWQFSDSTMIAWLCCSRSNLRITWLKFLELRTFFSVSLSILWLSYCRTGTELWDSRDEIKSQSKRQPGFSVLVKTFYEIPAFEVWRNHSNRS